MSALAKRMDAGISPARTVHSDLLPGDLEKCSLDSILDGVAACLTLPRRSPCRRRRRSI